MAGDCSMVISAACHHKGNEIEGAEVAGGKVQWGVVSGIHSTREGADLEEIGHCAFSNDEVESSDREGIRWARSRHGYVVLYPKKILLYLITEDPYCSSDLLFK